MNDKIDALTLLDEAIVVLKSAQLGANSESIGGVNVESVQAACARIAGRLEHAEAARAAIVNLLDASPALIALYRIKWGNLDPDANAVLAEFERALAAIRQ